jgi:hypothetical protein
METVINLSIIQLNEPYQYCNINVPYIGNLETFDQKVNDIIEELGYNKVEVHIMNPEEFSDEDLKTLDDLEYVYL